MGAKMTDNSLLLMAGINPKNGLPTRITSSDKTMLKENIRKVIRIVDEQDAVNRYVWLNLPCNLSSQELERLLYYRYQLAFFYISDLDQFYFMPYALDGTLDFYGRFNSIHPVPMNSSGTEEDGKNNPLSLMVKNCKYDVVSPEDEDEAIKLMKDSCVLLHDYTRQLSQSGAIPRYELNEAIIDAEAECIPFMRTSLIAGSGIKGMRVNDTDQQNSVAAANKSVLHSALKGELWTPIVGAIEFQELTNGQPIKSEEYMISMQSLDNFRLSTYGLDNGGLFEKKAHMLESENAMNQSVNNMPLIDGLEIRQRFCTIANSIWGLGMWCVSSQEYYGMQQTDTEPMDSDTEGEENEEDSEDSTI